MSCGSCLQSTTAVCCFRRCFATSSKESRAGWISRTLNALGKVPSDQSPDALRRQRSSAMARKAPWSPVWKSKFYGAFVLNHRVVLHAIDAMPARWRGDAGSSPLKPACTRRTG